MAYHLCKWSGDWRRRRICATLQLALPTKIFIVSVLIRQSCNKDTYCYGGHAFFWHGAQLEPCAGLATANCLTIALAACRTQGSRGMNKPTGGVIFEEFEHVVWYFC